MSTHSPLPDGWYGRFMNDVDLDRSYAELEGCDHFYADTMRGYIRFLQLRCHEAAELFERAHLASLTAEETIPNLTRQFLLNAYCFANALFLGPANGELEPPTTSIPTLPKHVLDEYPEVRLVLNWRKSVEGTLRLHLGEYSVAKTVFQELLDKDPGGSPDRTINYFLGLAAANSNLGLEKEALVNLDKAGLAIHAATANLNRILYTAVIAGFYEFLGRDDEAAEWRWYLDRIDCPDKTRAVFRRRAEIVFERCLDSSRLVLI